MSKAVRTLLMWLMALALPLQGVSAATMAVCGVGHHGLARTSAETASPEASHAHRHDAASAHKHEHEHGGAFHTQLEKADLAKDVGHKCSACAACCLGAAVATHVASFEPVQLPEVFSSLVARTLPVHLNQGLERPPRPFLA